LVIDSNAVLLTPGTPQALEAVSGRHRQILQVVDPIDLIELPASRSPQYARARSSSGRGLSPVEDILGTLVPE
jgi:hypothetical protein